MFKAFYHAFLPVWDPQQLQSLPTNETPIRLSIDYMQYQLKAARDRLGMTRNQHRALGQGLAFYGLRPYVPGDDVRQLDWHVLARSRQPHIRQHEPEQRSTVWLIIDATAPMWTGHQHPLVFYGIQLGQLLCAWFYDCPIGVCLVTDTDDPRVVSCPPQAATQTFQWLGTHYPQAEINRMPRLHHSEETDPWLCFWETALRDSHWFLPQDTLMLITDCRQTHNSLQLKHPHQLWCLMDDWLQRLTPSSTSWPIVTADEWGIATPGNNSPEIPTLNTRAGVEIIDINQELSQQLWQAVARNRFTL